MDKNLLRIISLAICIGLSAAAHAQSLDGYWSGAIKVQGQELGICFDVAASPDGGYKATMDVPAQGAAGIKVDAFSSEGLGVKAEIGVIGASYEGMHIKGIISGTFTQNGMALPLTLKKLRRPQEPRAPFPYDEEEVSFFNATDSIRLSGTLTLPRDSEGLVPAVVLVTGSGTQDRDESLMGHRPFALIADYLTRRGIAVLRYDDRGAGLSESGPAGATTLDLSRDAAAAVEFLRGRDGLACVGVAGHSEGGSIAYMLGAQKIVDFIVSLAGPTVSGAKVLDAQRRAIYSAQGISAEAIEENAALFAQLDTILARHDTPEEARGEVMTALSELPAAQREQVASQLLSPWMFWSNRYDPTDDILACICPVLALNGGKDLQVVPEQNISRLQSLCSDRPTLQTKVYPGLNHLFQHCGTGLPAEYGAIEETFSEEVLQDIAEFILIQKR